MSNHEEKPLSQRAQNKLRADKIAGMTVDEICHELRVLQRSRAVTMRFRQMQANRIQAVVAGTIGYSNTMDESARKEKFKEASSVIEQIMMDDAHPNNLAEVVRVTYVGIQAFNELMKGLEREMVQMASALPVAKWVAEQDQRGFGLLSLATVVGECGNLNNYMGPMKLWRRFGLMPWTFPRYEPQDNEEPGTPMPRHPDAKVLMGSTWRVGRQGKLPAEEWSKFGYSPRRRSISYLIGVALLKTNMLKKGESVVWVGPYRKRYDQAREEFLANHAGDEMYTPLRAHRHGMAAMTKQLLKVLWCKWNNRPVSNRENWRDLHGDISKWKREFVERKEAEAVMNRAEDTVS